MSVSTMSAILMACLFLTCLQTNTVRAKLAAPHNVKVISLNTNYTLTWDWDQSTSESHNVTFTTQYVPKYKLRFNNTGIKWFTACEKTSHKSCDLTAFNLLYLGIFMLRVRANVNDHHSDWMHREFCPDKDAAIGPPAKVKLSPAGSQLDVFISDPLTSTNTSMKDKIPKLQYRILYWEHFTDTQDLRAKTVKSRVNVVTLPNLKAWTWYCVKVQSHYDYFNKSSTFTQPHCMQTEGAIPWWQIFLYFLGSLMFFFMVVLLTLLGFYRCYKSIKATFFPTITLPSMLNQYLCDSPGSDVPRLLTPDSESELLCDKLTVLTDPIVLEVHNPPPEALPALPLGLEPESSGRHIRQDSSGSRDSGVYSTEGSSNLQQPNSSQTSARTEASRQGPVDLEQVKMRNMAAGLKSHCVITDEGIADLCV